MKRVLFVGAVIVLLVAALVSWQWETLLLAARARDAVPQTLAERVALIAPSVETHYPQSDEYNLPVVLMFHGCAGPRMAFQRQWAKVMTDEGYAAVIVDSTGPRGYSREAASKSICSGKALIGQERAGDILAAIELAKADPRIDASRIILAGWSHGAWTIMDFLTMDTEHRRPVGLEGPLAPTPDIEGAILFYPHCGPGALSRAHSWRQSPPIIAFVPGADEIVDANACIRLFRKRIKKGAEIDLTIYENANHVFDDPFLEPQWRDWYRPNDHEDAARRIRGYLENRQD